MTDDDSGKKLRAAWLNPILDEARKRDVDITPLMDRAMITPTGPTAVVEFFGPDADPRVTDWKWVGYLLRHELGWDDVYPDFPGDFPGDFPEAPDLP